MARQYQLPQKLPSLLKRLEIMYSGHKDKLLHNILQNASVGVKENVYYDNWSGGTTGHLVIFYLDEIMLKQITDFSAQQKIAERICSDLNAAAKSIDNENFSSVTIELFDDNDPMCARSFFPFRQPSIDPDSLPIWRNGHIRLFISHRDAHKKAAAELAGALNSYGVSSFVAHDTIEPMEQWQDVILKALRSMEIMLVLLTNDFFDSVWTNQEVGFALGKGIPVLTVKMEQRDPQGFISRVQALKADITMPTGAVEHIYEILSEKLAQKDRLIQAAIQAFISSSDFSETKSRFQKMEYIKSLTEEQTSRLMKAYNENQSLHNAWYLTSKNRFVEFMETRTGKKFRITQKKINFRDVPQVDDLPF